MQVFKNKIFFILMCFITFYSISPSFAKMESPPNEMVGWYDCMEVPSPEEMVELQKIALAHSVDLNGILHSLPEHNPEAWGKVFGLSMHFSRFDRLAQVYGHQLFGSFLYFIDSAGEEPFAKLINLQPLEIQQRVRDFLYYEATNADVQIAKNNERILREKLKLIFPHNYSFASSDKLFESTILKR